MYMYEHIHVCTYVVYFGPLSQHWPEGGEVADGGLVEVRVWVPQVTAHLQASSTSTSIIIQSSQYNSSPSPDKDPGQNCPMSGQIIMMPNSEQILIHFPIIFQNVRTIFKCCCEHCLIIKLIRIVQAHANK